MDAKNFDMTSDMGYYNEKPKIQRQSKDSIIYISLKRLTDLTCSVLAIILFMPLFLMIALGVKLSSKGPVFYKQDRVGKNGRLFTIYKFRTMIVGAENLSLYLAPELIAHYKIHRKINNDPRVTRLGRFLRMTSLDELPQVLNILKGDMSLVGPRPLLPDEIDMYGSIFNVYITVRPGLTGLWQVKSRYKTILRDRARLDYEYLQNRGAFYDLSILFKTVGAVLSKKGAC